MALGHSDVPGKTSKLFEKVDGHNAQGSVPLFGPLLETGVEKNNSSTDNTLPSLEGSLRFEQRGSSEVAHPNEESSQSLASVLLKVKMSISTQYQQPMENHPILRTSKKIPEVLAPGGLPNSHKIIVDKVTAVLASPFHPSGDSDQEMSESEEEEVEKKTLEEVETQELDDLITLDQYQSSFRKEALSRKSNQSQLTPQNKGRLEVEEDDS